MLCVQWEEGTKEVKDGNHDSQRTPAALSGSSHLRLQLTSLAFHRKMFVFKNLSYLNKI